MELVIQKAIKQTLTKPYRQVFDAPKTNIYILSISARAKSEKQRGKNQTDDADLTIAINNVHLTHFSKEHKPMHKDAPFAFSGGQLNNCKKTVVIFTQLAAGQNMITLIPEHEPQVEQIKIYQLEDSEITNNKVMLEIEEQAEKGDRRPFYTFLFINQTLKNVTIDATVHKRLPDSDDLQIVVNNQVLKSIKTPIKRVKWKFWYLAAQMFYLADLIKSSGKELSERVKEKPYSVKRTIALNLSKARNIIEIMADEAPILHSVEFEFVELAIVEAEDYNDPKKTANMFNQNYVIKDSAFNDCRSMSEKDVQEFLDQYNVKDSGNHISKHKFDGHGVAYWITKAAKEHHINPKLLLTKLQTEQGLVKGQASINPTPNQLRYPLNVGKYDTGATLKGYSGFVKQIISGAFYLRKRYQEAVLNNYTHIVQRNYSEQDFFKVTIRCANTATYSLYRFTPWLYEGGELVYNVYSEFFGTQDLGGTLDMRQQTGLAKPRLLFILAGMFISALLIITIFKTGDTNQLPNEPLFYAKYIKELGRDLNFLTEIVVSDQRTIPKDELWCGAIWGKEYHGQFQAQLLRDGQVIEAINLTNPTLFIPELSEFDFDYYTLQDINRDGKKEELIIYEYASCNGNLISFIEIDVSTQSFRRIPIKEEDKDEHYKLFISKGKEAFKYTEDGFSVEYYDNVRGEWFKDFYEYDKKKRKYVYKNFRH